MNTIIKWDGISAKFYQVHQGMIDSWVRRYLAKSAGPHFNIAPIEPLRAVTMRAPEFVDEVVTLATLIINDARRYGRGGVEARILTIGPGDQSRAVIDEWEREHRDYSAEDILWFPSLENVEKVA